MAQLAEADKIDSTSFLNDLAERMRSLGNADFRDFVAVRTMQLRKTGRTDSGSADCSTTGT